MSTAGRRVALVAGLLMVLAVPAALAGGDGSRQDPAELRFTSKQPASATGASILIDYVNPNDPDAKPFGVDRVETIFHPGTRIDTSVPARCTPVQAGAPQEQCPEESEVGGGILHFDQGNSPTVSPAFPRILKFKVTLFNAPDLVLFRLDGTNNAVRGLLAPSEVRGDRRIRADVPPIPGGSPDNQLAIDLADIRYRQISNGRGNYITTPASCPVSGSWVNRLTFSYNDDADPDFEVVQSPQTRSPCASGGGPGGGGPGRTIAGTAGDDNLQGTDGNDRILCGAGDDRVNAGGGNDVVLCGSGGDSVRGGSGNDELHGESGNDDLFGDEGNDELDGASGDDRLVGGPGSDELRPGPGRDSSTQ